MDFKIGPPFRPPCGGWHTPPIVFLGPLYRHVRPSDLVNVGIYLNVTTTSPTPPSGFWIGGDIGMGGNSAWRAIAGPTPQLDPWRTPIPKVYLCSAATPPGGGVHGMAGYYAARTLLRREFGITGVPAVGPKLSP